jgi:hypothetical protein
MLAAAAARALTLRLTDITPGDDGVQRVVVVICVNSRMIMAMITNDDTGMSVFKEFRGVLAMAACCCQVSNQGCWGAAGGGRIKQR